MISSMYNYSYTHEYFDQTLVTSNDELWHSWRSVINAVAVENTTATQISETKECWVCLILDERKPENTMCCWLYGTIGSAEFTRKTRVSNLTVYICIIIFFSICSISNFN